MSHIERFNFVKLLLFIALPALIFSLLIPVSAAAKVSETKTGEEPSSKTHGNSANKNKFPNNESGNKNQNDSDNQNHGNGHPAPASAPQTLEHHETPDLHSTTVKQEPQQPPKPQPSTNSHKSTQIHLHLNQCYKSATNVYVHWNGNWIPMNNQGNSPLYKQFDGGQYVKDDITAFKLELDNKEIVFPVSAIKVGIEAEGTINYWLDKCEAGDENKQVQGSENPPTSPKNDDKKETPATPPNLVSTAQVNQTASNSGEEVKSPEQSKSISKNVHTTSNGELPKTGESSPIGYYLAGLVIVALGIYFWKASSKIRKQ